MRPVKSEAFGVRASKEMGSKYLWSSPIKQLESRISLSFYPWKPMSGYKIL